MNPPYTPMVDVLTPGRLGEAELVAFEVSENEARFSALRAAINARRPGSYGVKPGRYMRLHVAGGLVMSDTQLEQETNRDAIELARGDVLIGGLGLGLIVLPITRKTSVRSVTIVERSADVLALVGPQVMAAMIPDCSKKVSLSAGDVFTYTPPPRRRFDFIYMDIWPEICGDNLREIAQLHRAYRPRLRRGGTVRSWMQDELRAAWG